MEQVRALIDKLMDFYWSPLEPSSYVIPVVSEGRKTTAGIGLIARQDWAAWNLTYKRFGGVFNNVARMREAVVYFRALRSTFAVDRYHLDEIVDGGPLRFFVTVLSEAEFSVWYDIHRHEIVTATRLLIDQAFPHHANPATDTQETVQ